jgi:O-antigen ligase
MINFLFTALFFLTPLTFNLSNSEFFEVPKMYLVYLFTILIVSTHLFNYLKGLRPIFRHTLLDIPLVLFLASQTISTIFSIDTHTSFFGYYSRLNGGLLSLICYSLLYWTFVIYVTPNLKKSTIIATLASATIVTFFGILEHFNLTQYSVVKDIFKPVITSIATQKSHFFLPLYALVAKEFWQQDVVGRVFSTFGQPNWLAAYLCILVPVVLDLFLKSKSLWHRASYLFLVTSFWVCLLFTKSKSGIIATIISLTVYGLIYLYKNKKNNFSILVTSYLLLVFFSLTVSNPIKDLLIPSKNQPATTPASTQNLVVTPSEDIRKIVWQGSLQLWRQFPIIGTGPETFAYSYYWTRPASHNLTSEWNFVYNKAHNEYLNYLATSGTIGFLTYLLLIVFIIRLLLPHPYLLSSFITILITNFAGFSVVVTSLYFIFLPALIIEPITIHPKPSKPRLLLVMPFVICLAFLSKLFSLYLSDIAYHNQDLVSLSYAVSKNPNEPVYLSKFSQVLAKKSAETKDVSVIPQVISHLNRAIAISPFNLNLWKERAQTFLYLSLIDSKYYVYSLDALTKATRLAPTDAASFYLLGKFYSNISDYKNATPPLLQAISLKPNYDYATYLLGEIYFKQNDFIKSKEMFEKTLQIAPTNIDAQNYLSRIATSSANHN